MTCISIFIEHESKVLLLSTLGRDMKELHVPMCNVDLLLVAHYYRAKSTPLWDFVPHRNPLLSPKLIPQHCKDNFNIEKDSEG